MSDSYEMKEIDDAVYEIDCRRVTKGTDRVGQLVQKYLTVPEELLSE